MKLTRLLSGMSYEVLNGELNLEIMGLSDNSKSCRKNYMFFAIVGTKESGEKYIYEAVNNGAHCVVTQSYIDESDMIEGVTYIKVQNVRQAVSQISKNYYLPSGINFKIIGITGTNGKTTTSFMLGETLYSAGYNVCIIGTSGIFVNGKQLRGEKLTTPDPIELFSLFAFCSAVYIDYVVMEVSAHALELDKVFGVMFDYGIFTNLTEDHLDFFGNMGAYGKSKAKLFDKNASKEVIINNDDNFGKTLLLLRGNEGITYGTQNAEYQINKLCNNCFQLKYNNKKIKFNLTMPGEYNFFNATAAIIVLLKEGVKINHIKSSLKHLRLIDGRYNVFKTKQHGKVILDFAHTPDGLEKLLNNVRQNMKSDGRLISLFGCGGNRDKDKRPLMGEISAKYADFTIISIDNPRNELAESVMADIERGVKKVTINYEIIMPRAKAIERAISMSSPSDVVVISGKGTEPYYEVNGVKEFYREDIVIEAIIRNMER